MNPVGTPSAMATRLQRAAGLLTYAVARGLPEPRETVVTGESLALVFATLPDLADWALWFEVQIVDTTPDGLGGAQLHRASGPALGEGLSLLHLEEPVAAEADQPVPYRLTDKRAS
jgi:hypothetical protein